MNKTDLKNIIKDARQIFQAAGGDITIGEAYNLAVSNRNSDYLISVITSVEEPTVAIANHLLDIKTILGTRLKEIPEELNNIGGQLSNIYESNNGAGDIVEQLESINRAIVNAG
jgi:hypothetical protein